MAEQYEPINRLTPSMAARHLALTLGDSMTAVDAGRHFTCFEADAIADVMRSVNEDQAAAIWLQGHAAGDDEGDRHYDPELER